MDKKPEEISLMENFSYDLKHANGHLRTSPVLRFTCPTPPEQRNVLQPKPEGNGSNLRRKISRSASHISGYSQNFDEKGDGSYNSKSLDITHEARKISSSEGDMTEKRFPVSPFRHSKHQLNGRKISQGSIFESAFPAVPPLRQTSINPGQKVVQVSNLFLNVPFYMKYRVDDVFCLPIHVSIHECE